MSKISVVQNSVQKHEGFSISSHARHRNRASAPPNSQGAARSNSKHYKNTTLFDDSSLQREDGTRCAVRRPAVQMYDSILKLIFVRVFDVFFCISGPAPGEFSFNGEQNCPCVRNLARPRLPNCQTHDQEQKNISKKLVFLMF